MKRIMSSTFPPEFLQAQKNENAWSLFNIIYIIQRDEKKYNHKC